MENGSVEGIDGIRRDRRIHIYPLCDACSLFRLRNHRPRLFDRCERFKVKMHAKPHCCSKYMRSGASWSMPWRDVVVRITRNGPDPQELRVLDSAAREAGNKRSSACHSPARQGPFCPRTKVLICYFTKHCLNTLSRTSLLSRNAITLVPRPLTIRPCCRLAGALHCLPD